MSDSGVRNVGTIAPKGAGKTTLVEAILYSASQIEQMGRIENGDTVSDFDPEEGDRQMSLFPSVCSFQWKKQNCICCVLDNGVKHTIKRQNGLRVISHIFSVA